MTVYEKSRGIGGNYKLFLKLGRLHSKSKDNFSFDMGAPYFTCRNEIFKKFILQK